MNRFLTITKTELKLSLRSLDLIFFAFAMPVVIVTIIGLIYKGDYELGPYVSIGICAVGLMGLPMVLSDYRDKKILKRLQVTPVSPKLLLFIQFIVQGLMAIISGLLVVVTSVLFFGYRLKGGIGSFLISYFLVLVSIFSIGLLIASVAPNIKKAGFLCSIIYFPMLLLSGTTIPFNILPRGLKAFSNIMPVTQGIKLLNGVGAGGKIEDYLIQIVVLILIALVSILLSVKTFKWDME